MGRPAAAQGPVDEIQVYDAGIAAPGKFSLTLHTNFTPDGAKAPAFPGAIVSNHSFDGGFEWAYGARPWLELGVYMPLYSVTDKYGPTVNGGKLRVLFVSPNADDRPFFYGANFEFSVNARRWDATRFTSEVRPIVGWHLKPWDIILNPIVDTAYDGLKNLEFVPATRVAYNFSSGWTLAAEEYDDFGPLRRFVARSKQAHQIYAVVDRGWNGWEIEGGVGVGMTDGSDRLTFKLIVARDLNRPKTAR